MSQNNSGNVRFIKVRGRIVPIRGGGGGGASRGPSEKQQNRQKALRSGVGATTGAVTAAAASGFGLRKASISGTQKIAKNYLSTIQGIEKAHATHSKNVTGMIDKSVRSGKWLPKDIQPLTALRTQGHMALDKAFFAAGHKQNAQLAAHAKKFSRGRMRAGILGASLLGAGIGAFAGRRTKKD